MAANPWVLGIGCSHNGSACLLHGDEVVAAIQDERLVRVKRQVSRVRFARHCVAYCLETAGIRPHDLDLIVYSRVRGDAPGTEGDIFLNEYLDVGNSKVPVLSIPHHYGHAVSAFATSGVSDAAVLVVDGSGTPFGRLPQNERAVVLNADVDDRDLEWLSHYEAHGTTLTPISKQIVRRSGYGPQAVTFGSLGDMYGVVANWVFGSFTEGPGKLMGLAPYGRPSTPIERWLSIEPSGVIHFNPEGYLESRDSCSWPHEFQACADLAASVQQAIEYALLKVVEGIRMRSSSDSLCYAGGVALNSVANEPIVRRGGFKNVVIFPAAEDSGVAVGAAFHGLWTLTGQNTCRRVRHDAMGRTYSVGEIDRAIATTPAVFASTPCDPAHQVAALLCEGKIVGWFEGRSELGPRSLGQRTLLCDPRRPDGKDVLNRRVKHREGFRPFAPVILREHVEEWFDVPAALADSPFMLRVWRFREGTAARAPAVAHVDNSARVQTITADTHPALYRVIEAFYAMTGVPMLLNTSFNVAGEPIVESPQDALWCLLQTGIDCCVFGTRIVHKRDGFVSVLDLCPKIAARSILVDVPICDGQLVGWIGRSSLRRTPPRMALAPVELDSIRAARMSADAGGPVAYGYIDGRWGELTVRLTEDYLNLLKRIDGRSSGRDLMRTAPQWTEEWLQDALRTLCRASLIRFS